ncbi:phytanoyl-CoA dioxygenase family protein [Sphingomonas sp. HF-S3]|uniref:Phytanoyl-CoA dioxygenase family protein n=1 Tax=Sphingomonas rustica TaxID=3103142 RepID=A0ABV0B5R1_9SPHN
MTDAYRQAGVALVRGAIDPALIDEWRDPIIETASRLPNTARDNEITAILQPDRADPLILNILTSPFLGRVAAEVLGTDRIRLIAGAVYIKPPGAPATFWHQDLWFFPVADAPMTTLWLPLTRVAEDNAPMLYAAGSQQAGFIDWEEETLPTDWSVECLCPMATGDVAIHDGWTLHASRANTSDRPREAVGLSFIPDGTRFATRDSLRREPARWNRLSSYLDHDGYREGDVIEGPGCPLVALS